MPTWRSSRASNGLPPMRISRSPWAARRSPLEAVDWAAERIPCRNGTIRPIANWDCEGYCLRFLPWRSNSWIHHRGRRRRGGKIWVRKAFVILSADVMRLRPTTVHENDSLRTLEICHPERSEGPAVFLSKAEQKQVLRCAQDDKFWTSCPYFHGSRRHQS